jgi:hypothetical protein
MLRRRRRTLGTLAVTAMVAAPAAFVLSAWLWVVAVPAVLLLGGYVGWLRTQVRREYERRTRRAALFGGASTAVAPSGHTARRPARMAAAVAAEEAARMPDRSWRPVPVPAPTYVSAPVARRHIANAVDLDDEDLSFTELEAVGAYARRRAVNE